MYGVRDRRGIFRPRARYFPWMESTQRSPGRRPHKVRFTRNAQAWAFLVRSLARPLPTTTLGRGWVPGGSAPYDFRTRGARLENGLNLFGAGMNLGPLRPPPAAARANQIRCPSFSTLRLSCALPFRPYLVGAAPCGGPRADEDIRPYGVQHPGSLVGAAVLSGPSFGRMGTSAPTPEYR